VSAPDPVEHMMCGQPVMHHAFTVVFTSVGPRFENRQPHQHEQANAEPDEPRNLFSIHGSLLFDRSHAYIVGQREEKTQLNARREGQLQGVMRRRCCSASGFAGKLSARLDCFAFFREFMNRFLLLTCLAAALCGCSNDPASGHHSPPKDPPDYHGVPTDDRPPSMLNDTDTPATLPAASQNKAQSQ
jgi:hypothetical protein